MDVLVVEDNELMARSLAKVLEREGYRPAVFHTGGAALDFVAANTPAVAVIDVHLPDISGLVLSQKLRERFGPETPIVVLSGDTSMETLNSLRHVGATYFLSKPVNTAHLLEQLREWVQDPEPTQ